jgi:hypothetical protein
MFGHHDVTDDHASIARSHLFKDGEEAITAMGRTQKRQASIAGTSDKVQVMSAVCAMQTAGHDKSHTIGSIVPALAKSARAGHPQFLNGKQKPANPGHPSQEAASIRVIGGNRS